MSAAQRDLIGGALVILAGSAFAFGASRLDLGVVTNMGGGYFPLVVASLTILFGAIILVRAVAAYFAHGHGTRLNEISAGIGWRSPAAVFAGVAMFAFAMTYLGFIPAVFGSVFLATFADPEARPIESLILSAAAAAAGWAIFVYGLGIQAPTFAWAF